MKLASFVGVGLSAAVALGCSGKTNLGDDGGAGNSSGGEIGNAGSAGTAGNAGSVASAGGPPASLDLTPPTDTCPASCGDAAGTVQPTTGVEQFYARILGRWLICGDKGGAYPGPADVIGVEYAAPTQQDTVLGRIWRGNMYYLVDGQDGPERGQGFDYQLTYDVSPQDPAEGAPSQLNMHPTPNSGFGGAFLYSPCPREWSMSGGSAAPDSGAVLVPAK